MMAMLETARFGIPLLAAGQAHKELFHNEALARLDLLVHPVVKAIEPDPDILAPEPGEAWLVGPGAVNGWLNHDDQIAGWTGSGWVFIAAVAGMRVYVESANGFAIYNGSWHLAEPVTAPASGSVVDAEARAVIDSILTALRNEGILPADG